MQGRAFRDARIVGAVDRGFARLPEKNDAEELDHDIAGQRGGERNQRGAERQQHVDERVRHRCANRNDWSSSHSETNPFNGGSPAMASAPISVSPRNPGHAVDEAAEVAKVALAGGVQHRPRARETAGSS